MKEEHKKFLDDLREEGSVNMHGSHKNLADEFDLNMGEAIAIVKEWMLNFTFDKDRKL